MLYWRSFGTASQRLFSTSTSKPLLGRVAVVTGGATGIGYGITREFLKAGASVAILGNQPPLELETVVRALREEFPDTDVLFNHMDVTKRESCECAIHRVTHDLGRVDVLINNAGFEGDVLPVERYTDEMWDAVMNVNLRSNFYMSRAILPHFRQRFEQEICGKDFPWNGAHPHAGSIIVVSSIAGKQGMPNLTPYSASNFARIGFAKSLALEVKDIAVNVNALCPGIVWSPMWSRLAGAMKATIDEDEFTSFERAVRALIPQDRPQLPSDIGAMAVYLATHPEITAQDICVDGGNTHF